MISLTYSSDRNIYLFLMVSKLMVGQSRSLYVIAKRWFPNEENKYFFLYRNNSLLYSLETEKSCLYIKH